MPGSSPRALVLLFTLLGITAAIAADEKPDAQFLATALAQQEPACGPSLQVAYTVSPEVPKPGHRRWVVRYVRTKDVLFKEERWAEYSNSNDWRDLFVLRRRYDRLSGSYKEVITYPDGKVSRAAMLTDSSLPGRFVSTTYLLDPPLFWLRAGTLASILKSANSVDSVSHDVDGHACWQVGVPAKHLGNPGKDYSYTVWVDPSIGFCPRRLTETSSIAGKSESETYNFTDYVRLPGDVYIPKLVTLTMPSLKDQTFTMRIEITSADSGKEIPAADLAVIIPSGTEVDVLDVGTSIKAP